MSKGLPLDAFSVVIRAGKDPALLEQEFALLMAEFAALAPPLAREWSYDLFLSYAHLDQTPVFEGG
jgi:hypothetical protein